METEVLEPSDVLEVYGEDGSLIYSTRGFVCFSFDAERSITTLQIRKLKGIRSDEILPIDAEYMIGKDGQLIGIDRESYLCSLEELSGKRFGDKLDNPRVYRTEWEQVGDLRIPRPKLWTPEKPFLGPNAVVLDHPHVWAPDDMLSRILDGLDVPGFAGRWKEIEPEKEKNALEKD